MTPAVPPRLDEAMAMQVSVQPDSFFEPLAGRIVRLVEMRLPEPPPGGVRVIECRTGLAYPETKPIVDETSPYRVHLSVHGDFYGQFAYQFAHELGHIYADTRVTNLLIETLVSTLSLQVLLGLGFEGYLSELTNHMLPGEFSPATVRGAALTGDWPSVTSYLKSQFQTLNSDRYMPILNERSTEVRVFEQLGAMVLLGTGVPWKSVLCEIGRRLNPHLSYDGTLQDSPVPSNSGEDGRVLQVLGMT